MAQVTYGSITLVDLSDVGQLSVYPTSNMPLSIIYDPDQTSYTPNWGNNNLILSPTVYYNTTQLIPPTTGLTITWKRRVGIESPTGLITGEEIQQTDGSLKVSANQFTPNSSMLTYIVTAEYDEPDTGQRLRAEGQITFSLVKLASSAKTCIISGENVFKYDKDGTLVSNNPIVLTATVNNVTISTWQYKKSDGTWANYPNLTAAQLKQSTLSVNTNHNVFVSDVATIRVNTSDNNVYDIHSITRLRDGAPGDKAVSAVLTNENQRIPCDASGNPIDHAFDEATSQIIIYNGGVDDTSNWTISTAGTNVTFTKTGSTVSVSNLTSPTGSVTFTCSRTGYGNIIKTFSLVKVTAGQNGTSPVIHSLDCSALAVNKTTPSETGTAVTFSPATITINAYRQEGNSAKGLYEGRFWIKAGSTDIYKSNTRDESSCTLNSTLMSNASTYMTVELYENGSFTTLLDSQTIVFTSDGAQGEQGKTGAAGADAINVVMGNYADVIPCSPTNYPLSKFTIDIPFVGYKGTTQVGCTVASPPKILGISAKTNTPATASSVGHLIYEIPTSKLVNTASATVTISFTCENKTIIHNYTWTRSTAATNGENAILFELYTTSGNVFTSRESQDITIKGRLMDGSIDETSSITGSNWVWARYDVNQADYVDIATGTEGYNINGSELTVNNSVVQGYASFRCTCTYSNTPYVAYYSLIDKFDPIQAAVFCSLGDQIVNGQGIGAFYVIVTDTGNGQELDALKSDRFLTSAPENPATGDFYYHLDSTNKTVVLKKYSGSGWVDATGSDIPTGEYTWSFRDSSGNPTTFNGSATASGKVIYVDGTLVTKKIIADVKVEI